MAELGIIASVAQIADVGLRLSIKLYTFGEIVASADRSVISISKDVSLTSGVLKELGHILDKDKETRTFSENAVQTADGVVKECLEVFQEMENILVKKMPSLAKGEGRDGKSGERTKRAMVMLERLKWGYLQPKLQLLRSNLDRLKSTLLLMLNVITYARQVSGKTESPSVIAEQKSLIEDLAHSNQDYVRKFEKLKLGIEGSAVEHVNDARNIGATERGPSIMTRSLPGASTHKIGRTRFATGELPLQKNEHTRSLSSRELTTATRSPPKAQSNVTKSREILPDAAVNAAVGNAFISTSVQTNIAMPPVQERGIPTTEAPVGFEQEALFKQLEHYSMLIQNLLKEVDEAQYKITFKSRLRVKGGIAGLHESERQELERIWGGTALQGAEQRLESLLEGLGEMPMINTHGARDPGKGRKKSYLPMTAHLGLEDKEQEEAAGWTPRPIPYGRLSHANSGTGISSVAGPSNVPLPVDEAVAKEGRLIDVSEDRKTPSRLTAGAFRSHYSGTDADYYVSEEKTTKPSNLVSSASTDKLMKIKHSALRAELDTKPAKVTTLGGTNTRTLRRKNHKGLALSASPSAGDAKLPDTPLSFRAQSPHGVPEFYGPTNDELTQEARVPPVFRQRRDRVKVASGTDYPPVGNRGRPMGSRARKKTQILHGQDGMPKDARFSMSVELGEEELAVLESQARAGRRASSTTQEPIPLSHQAATNQARSYSHSNIQPCGSGPLEQDPTLSGFTSLDEGANESYSKPFNSDLNHPDMIDSSDSDQFLQKNDGEFNFYYSRLVDGDGVHIDDFYPSTFETDDGVKTGGGPNIREPFDLEQSSRKNDTSQVESTGRVVEEVREDHDEKMREDMKHEHNISAQSNSRFVVDKANLKPARARLKGSEDWNTSPSAVPVPFAGGDRVRTLMDIMRERRDREARKKAESDRGQREQEKEEQRRIQEEQQSEPGGNYPQTKKSESPMEKPSLPPTESKSSLEELADVTATYSRPQLPPIQGLGPAITIMPPQKDNVILEHGSGFDPTAEGVSEELGGRHQGQRVPPPPTSQSHDPSFDPFLRQQQDALQHQEVDQDVVPASLRAPPQHRGTPHPQSQYTRVGGGIQVWENDGKAIGEAEFLPAGGTQSLHGLSAEFKAVVGEQDAGSADPFQWQPEAEDLNDFSEDRAVRRLARSRSSSLIYERSRDASPLGGESGLIKYEQDPVYNQGEVSEYYYRSASPQGYNSNTEDAMIPAAAAGAAYGAQTQRDMDRGQRQRSISSESDDGYRNRRHRRHKGGSRSRSEDVTAAALAAGAAKMAASEHEKRKQRKREKKEERKRQESAHAPDPALAPGDEVEDYIIKCICGFREDDGNTVYCDLCDTWQHTECYYIDKHGNVPTKEELEVIDHFCADCHPRSLNAKGAIERQRIRRKELDSGDRKAKNPAAKSYKKKIRGPESNEWDHNNQELLNDNAGQNLRDQQLPSKRPKTYHRLSHSTQLPILSHNLNLHPHKRSGSTVHSPSKVPGRYSPIEYAKEPYSDQSLSLAEQALHGHQDTYAHPQYQPNSLLSAGDPNEGQQTRAPYYTPPPGQEYLRVTPALSGQLHPDYPHIGFGKVDSVLEREQVEPWQREGEQGESRLADMEVADRLVLLWTTVKPL